MASASVLPAAQSSFEPLPAPERVEAIDVLRGWALFGILVVNMTVDVRWEHLVAQWPGVANQIVFHAVQVFGQEKFYTLFSFLFGLGFYIQMSRAEMRGAAFLLTYTRRLVVLYGFGLAQVLLLGNNQLRIYATLGFLLLFLRRAPTKLLLVLAFACMLIGPIRSLPRAWQQQQTSSDPAVVQAQLSTAARALGDDLRWEQDDLRVHSTGSLTEIMTFHASGIWRPHQAFPWLMPLSWLAMEFPLLLLGFYAGRRGIFENLAAHLPFARKVMWWGLALGLPGCVLAHAVSQMDAPVWWTRELGKLLWGFSAPALSFFYAAAVVLLFTGTAWRRPLSLLAPAGRTALSNYILQWVAIILITYPLGLGLYAEFGPAVGLPLALAIFGFQLVLSSWYLRRFRFGPAEWLWRSLTYGKWQPMRVDPAPRAAGVGG